MARKGGKILLTGIDAWNWATPPRDFLDLSELWRARRELNPRQPGVFCEVKASPEMALPVLYLFRIPVRNLAELRARATAEFDLIYIS